MVVQLDTTKKDVMDNFQCVKRKMILILSLILQKLGALAKTFIAECKKKGSVGIPKEAGTNNEPVGASECHQQS
jgi:hypothetical protein